MKTLSFRYLLKTTMNQKTCITRLLAENMYIAIFLNNVCIIIHHEITIDRDDSKHQKYCHQKYHEKNI